MSNCALARAITLGSLVGWQGGGESIARGGAPRAERVGVCEPVGAGGQPNGVYLAEGKFYPLALFSLRLAADAPKARDLEGSAGLRGTNRGSETPCSIVGCAGRI